jgi:hypothetical protein
MTFSRQVLFFIERHKTEAHYSFRIEKGPGRSIGPARGLHSLYSNGVDLTLPYTHNSTTSPIVVSGVVCNHVQLSVDCFVFCFVRVRLVK